MAEQADVIEVRVLSSIATAVEVAVVACDYVCAGESGLHESVHYRLKVLEQVDGVTDAPILCHRFAITMIVGLAKIEDYQGSWFLVQMEHAV